MGLGILTYFHSQIPLAIYVFWIIVCAATLIGYRQYGYYFLLFLLPFTYSLNKVHRYPFGNQVLDVVFFCLVITAFIYRSEQAPSRNSKPIWLHIIVVLLSLLYGYLNEGPIPFGEFGHTFRVALVKNYLTMPLLYWITLGFIREKDPDQRRKIIVFFILFVVILVDWRFWDSTHWRSHSHFSYSVRDLAFGSLGANHLSAFVVEYTAVAISLLLNYKKRNARLFFITVIAAAIYPIFYTYSRAGYLAIIGVLLWNFLFRKKLFILILAILLLAGGAALKYLPQSVIERVTMTETENGEIEASAGTRFIIWEKGKQLFLENPIFGIGYQMVPGYIDEHGLRNLHNYIFQMLVETGIIGFSIFIYLLYSAFKSGWQLYKKSTDRFYRGLGLGFCGCVIASTICNLFGDRWSFPEMQSYWWVLWAVCDGKLKDIIPETFE